MSLTKTFTEGEVLTAADLNGVLGELDARDDAQQTLITRLDGLRIDVRVLGMLLGSASGIGDLRPRLAVGSQVITTNAAGDGIVQHGAGFARVATILAWSGDYANAAWVARNAGVGTSLANQFGIRAYNANGSVKAGPVRVDYLVLGY